MLLRNISLGMYYPGGSFLYRLQARTKLLIMLIFVVALIVAERSYWDFTPYLVAVTLVICGIACSGISFREMGRRLWFLLILVVLSIVIGLPAPAGASYNGRVLYTFPPLILSSTLLVGLILGALVLLL